MRKRSYWKNGVYHDVTTDRDYIPKQYCELCGSHFLLTVHHYLRQQKCMRDKKSKLSAPCMWTEDFINAHQKLFTLCVQCHADVEHLDNRRFLDKYHKQRSEYIYEV